jgi:O-antigen/teichoic acid export membrane protein
MKYVGVSLTGFIVQVGLNIYFVVVLKIGIAGILTGNAISALLVVLINMVLIRKNITLHFSFSMLKDLLKFGLPLISVGIFTWIIQFSDKFLIQRFASVHDVGLYSLGSRFANILSLLFIGPFATAWGGYCFQIAATDNAKESFKTITTYLLFVLSFVGLGLIVFSPLAIKLIASAQFWDAHKVVLPLVCANIAYSMFYTLGLGISIVKKTYYYSYIMCLGAILSVSLNVIFIPRYGMMAAGFVSFTCYTVIISITYYISQKLYYIPFEKMRLLKLGLLFFAVSAGAWKFQMSGILSDVIFRVALLLSFIMSLYLVKFFGKKEINFIRQRISTVLQQKGILNKIQFGYRLIKLS